MFYQKLTTGNAVSIRKVRQHTRLIQKLDMFLGLLLMDT